MRLCECCGVEFDARRSTQRYCTVKCRKRADHKRNDPTERPRKTAYTYVCKHCGVEYHPKEKNRNTYCSRECAYEERRVNAKGQRCEKRGTNVVCVICGKTFMARRPSKYCSNDCRLEHGRRRSKDLDKARFESKDLEYVCKQCGKVFRPEYGDKLRSFCSNRCSKKYADRTKPSNHQQRAKRYGVPYGWFSEMALFRRDGWRCYLCGIVTPERLRGTYEDQAPELDHVIPLSRGGGHMKNNVRCCCRHCNGLKSDMTLEELERAHSVTLKHRRAYAARVNEGHETRVKEMLRGIVGLKADELALLRQGRLFGDSF